MDTMFTFGEWLRRRRKVLDLTQAELAARVPCAKGTIRRLEADDLQPSKQLAEQLAGVLKIPAQLLPAFITFARNKAPDASAFPLAPTALGNPVTQAEPAPVPAQSKARYPLPTAANPLLGRFHLVAVIRELLLRADVRLLTLTGPPGVGKTRLALETAQQLQAAFADGVCFVPLAPLREPGQVLPTIAQTIELLDTGRNISAALTERLRDETVLLVLDNVEHLILAAREVAALLAGAPRLKVLCTSRVPLRIAGEHEFVVPPLALPGTDGMSDPVRLAANPAVALFIARAGAVQHGFGMTADNAQQLVAICHKLDGLPLAIELAATRIKLFSTADLLARLERRLPFLTGGTQDAPARQRTLAAAIDWSYELLNVDEKRCFARLSIFQGGWNLDAAEAICGHELDVTHILTVLVDHSLVYADHAAQGEVRFAMLETIREFALLRLQEQVDEQTLMEARHGRYFLTIAIQSEAQLQGPQQVIWMQRLHADNNNLRTAFVWSLADTGDVELGLRAGAALWWFWWTNGQLAEGSQLLSALLQRAQENNRAGAATYGRGLLGAGILAYFSGDFVTAQRQFEAAREIGAQQNDDITQGYATFMLGTVQTLSNNKAAGAALLDQGYARLSQAGTAATWHVGVTSLARVLLSFELGRLDDAQHFADAGMQIFQRLGQPYGIGLAFNYQGDVARLRNDAATAAASYKAALPLLRQANARSEIPAVLHNLGHVLLSQGESATAYTTFVEALELHREIGNRMGMTECLIGLAATALTNQQPQMAATLLGAADQLLAQSNMPLLAAEQASYAQTAAAAEQALGAEKLERVRQRGQAMTPAEVLQFVILKSE